MMTSGSDTGAARVLGLSILIGSLALASMAAAAADGDLAYVSNQQGAVSVIDLSSMEVKETLAIEGRAPRGIGLTDSGRWLVTANKDDENISVVDRVTGKLVAHIPIGTNPEFVRVRDDLAFVTYEPSMQTQPAAKRPVSNEKGEADDELPGHIAVADLKAGKVILDIVGKPETEGLEFSRDGKQLIVANESDNSLSVLDISTGALQSLVSLAHYGMRPRGIKLSPVGDIYVATLEFSAKLLVLNDRFEVVKEISTGKSPYGVSFDRSGNRVFVAAARDSLLQVFDTRTWAKIKDIPVSERCWHFSFTPDDAQILLACGRSNEVLVIDATKLEVTRHIPNLLVPWGIVTYPKSMGSLDQP